MVGTIGDLGCFSFFSKKQLCVGEGGMVVTADADSADRVRLLRSHAMTSVTWDRHRGYAESYDVIDFGFNFRMDEPRAALGAISLSSASTTTSRSAAHSCDVPGGAQRPGRPSSSHLDDEDVDRSSHFAFPVVLAGPRDPRLAFRAQLAALGIQTTAYPRITCADAYRDQSASSLSRSRASRGLSLRAAAVVADDRGGRRPGRAGRVAR